jgi:hypothetical protein
MYKFGHTKLIILDRFNGLIPFDLDKSRQKFYHGLKEHRKISNIP